VPRGCCDEFVGGILDIESSQVHGGALTELRVDFCKFGLKLLVP
jgi:hypothetical protein